MKVMSFNLFFLFLGGLCLEAATHNQEQRPPYQYQVSVPVQSRIVEAEYFHLERLPTPQEPLRYSSWTEVPFVGALVNAKTQNVAGLSTLRLVTGQKMRSLDNGTSELIDLEAQLTHPLPALTEREETVNIIQHKDPKSGMLFLGLSFSRSEVDQSRRDYVQRLHFPDSKNIEADLDDYFHPKHKLHFIGFIYLGDESQTGYFVRGTLKENKVIARSEKWGNSHSSGVQDILVRNDNLNDRWQLNKLIHKNNQDGSRLKLRKQIEGLQSAEPSEILQIKIKAAGLLQHELIARLELKRSHAIQLFQDNTVEPGVEFIAHNDKSLLKDEKEPPRSDLFHMWTSFSLKGFKLKNPQHYNLSPTSHPSFGILSTFKADLQHSNFDCQWLHDTHRPFYGFEHTQGGIQIGQYFFLRQNKEEKYAQVDAAYSFRVGSKDILFEYGLWNYYWDPETNEWEENKRASLNSLTLIKPSTFPFSQPTF